jgi:hypothetical protein
LRTTYWSYQQVLGYFPRYDRGWRLGWTHLGTEAVSSSSNLAESQTLERLNALDDNGVDLLGRVRVIAGAALSKPAHEVEIGRSGIGTLVAVEQVGDQASVAFLGELVGEELAVVPDTENVGDVEDADVLRLVCGGSCEVGGDGVVGDLDHFTLRFAPGEWVSCRGGLLFS